MNSSYLSALPSTVLLQFILPFLSVKEALRFDIAITDKSYREEMCKQITNYINSVINQSFIGFEELEWLVKRNANITRLFFQAQVDTTELATKLTNCLLFCNTSLTDLTILVGNVIALIPSCALLPNLERFCLITDELPVSLSHFWSQHKTLKHVALYGQISKDSDSILKLVESCTQLVSFDLTGYIYDGLIDALATHCPLLERICLVSTYADYKEKLTEEPLIKLATNCVYLKELILCDFKDLIDTIVMAFVPHMSYITCLTLSGSKITNASIRLIVTDCHQLKSIDVTYCPLVTKSGYLHLKLIPTLTSITMLDLSGTEHTINPHTDDTGFANLLEIAEEANQPYTYDDGSEMEYFDDEDY